MKINIAASHRFHLLDLARELEKNGHEVRFYSYVPTNRAMKFGLKKESSYTLFYIMMPFLAIVKILNSSPLALKLIHLALDIFVSLFMKPCDVFIGLAPVYKRSFQCAKKKYGATIILEWGSKHILEQQKILSKLPNYKKQHTFFIKRCLTMYEFADYIALPSEHTKESFLLRGINKNKILLNPYAVNLSMFGPTTLSKDKSYDIIMVGAWSYRKGCDLLIELCKKYDYSLLHVGGIKDIEFPDLKNMKHIDPVDESNLKTYYSMAKVFVLPSREEGLALVQPQALISGLPIVCSQHTGGRDLRNFLDDKKWIIEMEKYSVQELKNCIAQALELANTQIGVRSYAKNVISQLTWESYGKRYVKNLKQIKKR
jgi:glycosyltransferase involved in cell wall biosynthesis